MASNPPGHCCTVGSLHKGEAKGKTIQVAGKIDAYLATPHEGAKVKDAVILFLTDVIGIWPNSKLMADLFAEQGYTTLMPDLFNHDALSVNRPADFDLLKWLREGSDGKNPHTPDAVDPVVEAAIKALRNEHCGKGAKRIFAVGYCFGAKYVARHYKNGIDVGFVAHPSFVEEDELAAIGGPLSIAAAENDTIFPVEKRQKSEEILRKTGQRYQINLWQGVSHGFAVRANLDNEWEKFCKEQAFYQALNWFDFHQ